MKKQCPIWFSLLGALLFSFFYGQELPVDSLPKQEKELDSIVVGHKGLDNNYREDQFYIGTTFNFLGDRPKGVRQSGFSGGLHLGFIRDFPINKKRNVGFGVGLGWSANTYRMNLLISQDEEGNSLFQVLDRTNFDYSKNRFATYLVEMPIQFRWRTSKPDDFRFWRIYGGLQLGYLYYFHAKFEQPGKQINLTKVEDLNRFRYGAFFVFGYNTFNFMLYYSLNSLFNGNTVDGGSVGISVFKVGLMFYIL